MKVTYTGKTVRNNKERTVTYTGGVGTPSVKNGVTATYIGGKQSKAVYDAEAKTREARQNRQQQLQQQTTTKREVGDISALGAGNYGADKRIFGEGYNVGQGLAKAGQIGLTQIAKAGSSAGAWLENQLGNFAREGTNGYWDPDTSKWLFNRWNQAIDAEAQGVQQRYAENTQRGGRSAEVFEDMAAATVAAIPQAGAAVLTGGASAAAQAGALAERAAATPGLVGTISRGMRAMAKDPNFQLSFVQVFGPGYEQAKADGADDLRASLYAVGNGLMNAAVEVGGGIQTLPKELQTGGNAWKSWVDSMLEEGKEEVVQGVIERAMQNTVYGRDNPYIGVGNGAIFDPAAAAEEFAGGAVVGGLLGGGQIGLNTLANRAAYNAAKAQYNRDVRQNTAPEMDSKAAQAVDAVTRGESITGNQAAAIAKNPVAVETLEANTGVKLNTQQPISQLKRDIAALASRDTTQTQPQGTTSTPVTQKRAQKPTGGFLEAGQKAYQEMSRTAEDVPTLYAGFSSVYNAGLNGIEASKAKGAYAAMLTPEQRYAAYNAGLEDAAAQVARENAEVKSVTTTAGAGLADNVYSRAVIAKSKRTAATLNAMGKKLGVRIEFVDSVMGGQANGQYIRDKNLIQIAVDSNKPYLNVAAHEVTHRMQDLSPAEYRKFRQAAMEHRMREKGIDEMAEFVEWYREKAESAGVTLTQDEVMDEIAADFAGNMMENPDMFREFSQSNRTAAQKLLDSLKEFIAKVKSIFTGKARDAAAQDAYGKDFAELEAVAQKWQEAFDAAERQAESATVSATVRSGDTMQYDDAVYSLRVTDKDTLDFLDKQKTITTYKTMQLVDGKLYPPMAARVDGKYEDASELGAWEMSVERPDLVKDGKFKLDKGKGQGSITAAYNPYMHSSNLVINDQFSGAYTRDNLVTVECEVPVSEMTSGYHADGAKDSVGWHSWHTGTVAGQVRRATGVERKVFLSRWIKPVRILPNAEVAHMYKELLGDTGIEVPDNVVTPGLLAELKKAGVPIKESGRVKTAGENVKPKFSLKAPVEETKNLLALHNLTEKNLLDAAKLGGLPMPSIAIVKADEGHGEYGDISFVFSKDTIDPQLFRSNKVYGYDAWTPTAPRIEYEVNEKSAKKIHDLFYRMERAKGRSFADPLYSAANTLEDELNRKGGVDKVVGAMRDDPRVMNIYLEDTGRGAVENVMKREVTRMDDNQQEMASFLIRELGADAVDGFRPTGNEAPIVARRRWFAEHGEALNEALRKYYEKLGLPAKDAADVVNAETNAAKTKYLLNTRKYLSGNTETVTEEVDLDATNNAIRKKVDKADYDRWLDELFKDVVKNEGIYNGKDYYTSSGNRRSFSATHYEITLENIVKAMKQGDQKGANTFFGGQAIWGVASKDYGSIDEIKADSGRLQKMTEEEYSAIRQKYSERLADLTNEIKDPTASNEFIASDDAASAIVETLRTKRTIAAIDKELRTYPTLQIKPDTAEKVLQLYKDISNMPTGYFEAKPQRAVGFDEVLAAVIPNDASAEVRAALENAGVRMIEYASGDEKSRLDAVNSVEGARFQLRSTADIEQEMRDLKRERTVLASRNRALEQRVQDLKGEMRISKEPSVVLRDVKRLGLDTIRRYDSDVKYADIQTDMEALGKAVMKKDVSMSDLMPYAKRVAEKIVDNTTELTEHGAELLEIRDYLKRQKILFNGEMDHYNEFRKQHMGTMKLNKTDGTPVDTIYAEMTEMFGEGYFPSDVYTEADKLYRIADVLDGMDVIYQNPFAGYRDAAVQEIANDIIDGMISDQVRQKKTYADRVALEKQEAVGRVREMLTKEREKRRDMVKRMRREYSEKTQKGREKRYAAEMRAKIARHTGPLSEKLLRPTDKKHIPEELRVVVADLLRNINLESAYSYDENGRLRKNAGGDPTRRTQEAVKLKKAYEDIIAREGNMVVDPDLLDSGGLLDSLAALGGKRIADMNVAELETVWNAVRAIEATLTSYDRTLANQKYARTSEWADSLMMGSMSRKRRNRKISLDMADPYTFFSAYGDGGMQVYRTLRNAQDREHVMLTELREAAKKFLDADVYKNRFERHTFTTSRGVELTLTNEQIMNLYNLAKRGEQAMNHLMVGGIVQPEIKRDGKLKAIPRGTENILLTLEDVKAITSVLTPEQIKVADGLQKLASTKLAEWGNEASMAVYGYRKFMEAHYWPIKTAKEATASSVEKGPDIAREIKNMGSAKALTPNASNALDIGGVYDVFAQNASDMIKYATLLAPIEDINRLYNYRYRDSMGNLTGKNVRQVLSGVYGDAAQSYWRNLMRDVQNGMVKNASATTRAVERIVGNTKGAAVGANLRVVIQQPTAYFRAAVALDPEYMVKGVKKGVTAGNGWDKARRWAPIAGIKDTSGFDQGSRYTIAREVYGTDGGVLEWLNDKSMALAGKADAVTWGKIWNACEWQVASETNLEVGSDAYYRQVAAVFTDVIDQTQVVDGIMQRAQIMRDSDALTRQATSFMGEPLKSLNMFMRAYDAWAYENNPQKRSSALKKLKRSVAALVVTDVVNALAQSIVDGLRDDDKDKNWAERILEAFTGYSGDEENAGEAVKNVVLGGNLISNMNPIGRIPYLKDILSILQGYTVDRMDAAAADDIIRTAKTFIKGLNGDTKTTTAYNLKQVMLMCSKVFGISIGNMGRDMWSIARSIASDTGNVRLMFEMEKAIYRMDKSAGNRKRWCELLYRAQKDNDTETARLIYKEMLEHGYEETDVRQGVEAIMKAEQKVKSVDDLKNRWRAP